MSRWISLHDKDDKIPTVESFGEGGTYVLGSSLEADLNATYNYGKHFPFKSLHGKKAGDTIPQLEDAVKRLGTEQHRNYWEPTEGNTGYACNICFNGQNNILNACGRCITKSWWGRA